MQVERLNPFKLPSIPITRKRELPDCPGVYFVLNGTEILYIGKTQSLENRLSTHNRLSQFPSTAMVAWFQPEDLLTLDETEKQFINYFKPLLNGTKNPLQKKKRLTVQLDSETLAWVKTIASQNDKSISNQILSIVKAALELVYEQNFCVVNGKLRPPLKKQ